MIRNRKESEERKAIGMTYQEYSRNQILKKFPMLGGEDIKSTPPSVHGSDLTFSVKAKKVFIDTSVEVKSAKRGLSYTYEILDQVNQHQKSAFTQYGIGICGDPTKYPIALMSLDTFLNLIKDIKTNKLDHELQEAMYKN